MGLAEYDPKRVVLTIGGMRILDLAEGAHIEVEFDDDDWTKVKGSSGKVIRCRNPDQSASITVTTMPSSPSNDVLSAWAAADKRVGGGVRPLSLQDLNGTSLVTAPKTWLRKRPKVSFGKQADQNYVWVFDTDEMDLVVGSLPELAP
jgi:hypothetical protein